MKKQIMDMIGKKGKKQRPGDETIDFDKLFSDEDAKFADVDPEDEDDYPDEEFDEVYGGDDYRSRTPKTAGRRSEPAEDYRDYDYDDRYDAPMRRNTEAGRDRVRREPAPRREEPRRESVRREEPKRESVRREAPKREPARKEAPRRETSSRKQAERKAAERKTAARKPAPKKKAPRKNVDREPVGERILDYIANTSFAERAAAIGAVIILIGAIVTLNFYKGALGMVNELKSFNKVGANFNVEGVVGAEGLSAIADAYRSGGSLEDPDEEGDEELAEENKNVNISMTLTSIKSDMKIKFVDTDTNKLVSNVPFVVSVETPDGTSVTYDDHDRDGIIYKNNLTAGVYKITPLALSEESDRYILPSDTKSLTIKDKVEMKVVDVSNEIKTEAEVNVAEEDTAVEEKVESQLKDTVDYIESTESEDANGGENDQEEFETIDRSLIVDPTTSSRRIAGYSLMRCAATSEEQGPVIIEEIDETPQQTTQQTTQQATQQTKEKSADDSAEVIVIEESSSEASTTTDNKTSTEKTEKSKESKESSQEEITIIEDPSSSGNASTAASTAASTEKTTDAGDTEVIVIEDPSGSSDAATSKDSAATAATTATTTTTTTDDVEVIDYSNDQKDASGSDAASEKKTTSEEVIDEENGSKKLEFMGYKVSVVKGKEFKLEPIDKNLKVTYSSDNKDIATVTKEGTIKGVAEGETIVQAKCKGYETAEITVTVTKDTTPLKDKDGNIIYVKENGKYREATADDLKRDDVVFYVDKGKDKDKKYTGWQTIDGKTYYYDKNGNYVTGEQVIQGAKYVFGDDGVLSTSSGTLGIDVSKWNGNIDWNKVKKSGINFAIIRCGYRGSSQGALIEDPQFRTNIQGATEAGLKVGVYFFTQAVNEVEAVEEASMVIDLINGYNLSMPVYLDVEGSNGRGDSVSASQRTANVKAFCGTIQSAGYRAGVYSNKTWYTTKLNASALTSYHMWLAQYAASVTYTATRYDMWQYTSKGSVSGISGNVDLDLLYN